MAWTPLESNPDVINKFLAELGVPQKWQVIDVLSLDPDMLGLIPRATLAFILLFPTNEKYEQFREKQDEQLKEKGQTISKNVYFTKQFISNACGTIAMLHSIANNLDSIELGDGFLKDFIKDTADKTPEERGVALQHHKSFADAHNTIAVEGQTEVPTDEKPVIHHFVAFVHKDGQLYELDGRKSFPINHGDTSVETFVEDAAKVMLQIIRSDPEEVRFTVCALSSQYD
ncbi:ubiquitin carboxyl-terminal hydrolase isozyme L3 [Cimex lectularius]|uniref:Ubiquitin carboxyl-terminal hydrolase n=1 Tax=Cimex lectularius TaxID=79782 RepID=A0A8I6RQ99_CIMLE|nr:ubiquitin carboxyl-terminal hydrolase isozyme L3 [Cimex lectularius]XP_014247945.1 ubiquitin carboxyl-terminal hydrolase isozyme L3 [Cimex lectularius]